VSKKEYLSCSKMNNPYFETMSSHRGPIRRTEFVNRLRGPVGKSVPDNVVDLNLWDGVVDHIISLAKAYISWARSEEALEYTPKLEKSYVSDHDEDESGLIMHVIDNYEGIESRLFKMLFFYSFNELALLERLG
tara:strand:- start:695 stop:1096 length:402 start_codon:yes stop_codon:yes gene_type:complete